MQCDYCHKVSDELPYKCKFCGETFCSEHRLPENHECIGLESYKGVKHEEFREDVVKAAKEYDAKSRAYARGRWDSRKMAMYAVILVIIALIVYYILRFVMH